MVSPRAIQGTNQVRVTFKPLERSWSRKYVSTQSFIDDEDEYMLDENSEFASGIVEDKHGRRLVTPGQMIVDDPQFMRYVSNF